MNPSNGQHAARHSLQGCFLVALAFVCLANTGCVRRRMTIRSFPAGAQVWVDDQEIGTTPCSTAFTYYGTRKIMVQKDGYKTETLFHQFTVPWYQYVPLDFINENLNPREIRDERIVDVTLASEVTVPPEQLMERANSLRNGARMGLITPLPDPQAAATIPHTGIPGEGLPGGQPIPYQSLPNPNAPQIPFLPTAPLGPPASTIGPPAGIVPPGAFGPPPLAPSGAVPPPSLAPRSLAPQTLAPQGPSSTFGQQPFGPPPLPSSVPVAPGPAQPGFSQPPSGSVPPPGSPSDFFPRRAFE